MPYTQAFLAEVLRYRPVGPVVSPHQLTSDLKVGKYHVPKGTDVTMNILAINWDPKVWSDPDVFRPERFLSEDGTRFVPRPEVVTFGAGKLELDRACKIQADNNVSLVSYRHKPKFFRILLFSIF